MRKLFTTRQAMEHILVTGRPGAGKTSGFLKPIQKQLLKDGARCMHCCVKPDEADRAASLMPHAVRFSPSSNYIFNPLTYTMQRKGARHLALFHDELNEVMTRSTSDKTESFWKSGVTDTICTAFELSFLVNGDAATYKDVYDIILSMPYNAEHAASDDFRHSACGRFLEAALLKDKDKAMPHADFILRRLPVVGEKARGAFITQSLTSIQPFVTYPLNNCVNGVSNLTPEMMVDGYTILDFDTLTYGINGLALQLLVSWFAMEEVLSRRSWKHPFMLIRDEYHLLSHARRDIQVMSVGRSQGFIGLSAFQTIPVLEDSLGAGVEAQTQAKALIGLHVNKIFCNNNCHVTNEFASESIGKERKMYFGGHNNPNEDLAWWDVLGVGKLGSISFNQQLHHRINPVEFTRLSTGGQENKYLVDAIVTRGTDHYEFVTVSQRKI